jgi:hypothetical protein
VLVLDNKQDVNGAQRRGRRRLELERLRLDRGFQSLKPGAFNTGFNLDELAAPHLGLRGRLELMRVHSRRQRLERVPLRRHLRAGAPRHRHQ